MGSCIKKQKEVQGKVGFMQENELEITRPIEALQGLHLIKNPFTGKIQGVPSQWIGKVNLQVEVDHQKTIPTGHLPQEIRPEKDLPQGIIDLINSQPVYLSDIISPDQQKPQKTTDTISMNLQIDLQKPYGIKNLPKAWQQQLKSSAIFPQDVLSDPQIAIDLISSYHQQVYQSKLSKKLLTTKEFERYIEKVEFIDDNPSKFYKFLDQLGKGGSCKVYEAVSRGNACERYAVRIIRNNQIRMLTKIRCQIAVMMLCASENIIKYHFTYFYKESLFMFIEFMNLGALTKLIQQRKKVPEKIIAYIIRQILRGLKTIHKRSQIHRDIKSDNILLDTEGNVKIADFGHALQLTRDKQQNQDVVGTPSWMAPQLIKKQQYTQSVDIWSLGIVVYELCYGDPPHLKQRVFKAMYLILSQPAPRLGNQYSPQLRNFVQCCLHKQPSSRSTVRQLLDHAFIRGIKDGAKQKTLLAQILKVKPIKK